MRTESISFILKCFCTLYFAEENEIISISYNYLDMKG